MSAPKPNYQPRAADPLEGALADLLELTLEDFERGSELVRRDLEPAARTSSSRRDRATDEGFVVLDHPWQRA